MGEGVYCYNHDYKLTLYQFKMQIFQKTHPLFSRVGKDLQEEVLALLDPKSAARFCLTSPHLTDRLYLLAIEHFSIRLYSILDDDDEISAFPSFHLSAKIYLNSALSVHRMWPDLFRDAHTGVCMLVKAKIEDPQVENTKALLDGFDMLEDYKKYAKRFAFDEFPSWMGDTLVFSMGVNPITGEDMISVVSRGSLSSAERQIEEAQELASASSMTPYYHT